MYVIFFCASSIIFIFLYKYSQFNNYSILYNHKEINYKIIKYLKNYETNSISS